MKIVVTGAKGQLGQELVKQFSDAGHNVVGYGSDQLDVTNAQQVMEQISTEKPDWVVHAAAWTKVDAAAENPDAAMAVNGQGARNVADACKAAGVRLVYISTNEVFAGEAGKTYTETDEPDPINAYGRSKLAGEVAVQEVLPVDEWVIARVSWLYGPTSEVNFPNKIIAAADKNGSLKVVDDEVSTPTYCPDVAEALLQVMDKQLSGILHLVNEGYGSRYDWAKEVMVQSGREDVPVEPIKLADFKRASTPPPHAVLLNTAAKERRIVLPEWTESNRRYCQLAQAS